MYLKRDGTQVEHLPVLDDYAKDDPNMAWRRPTSWNSSTRITTCSAALKTGTPTRTRVSAGFTC